MFTLVGLLTLDFYYILLGCYSLIITARQAKSKNHQMVMVMFWHNHHVVIWITEWGSLCWLWEDCEQHKICHLQYNQTDIFKVYFDQKLNIFKLKHRRGDWQRDIILLKTLDSFSLEPCQNAIHASKIIQEVLAVACSAMTYCTLLCACVVVCFGDVIDACAAESWWMFARINDSDCMSVGN